MKTLKIQEFQVFFSRLSGREKAIFYAVSCFLSLALLYFFIIWPVYSKMSTLDKEARKKELEMREALKILSQKDRILAESKKYNSFMSAAFKSEDEEVTFLLKEIEALADKSSVYLIDMKPADLKTIGSSNSYLVNLSCEGQMDQVVAFIYSIENSNKLMTIDKYQISPKSGESSIARCSMTISKIILNSKIAIEEPAVNESKPK